MRLDVVIGIEYDDTNLKNVQGNRIRLDSFNGIEYDDTTTYETSEQ